MSAATKSSSLLALARASPRTSRTLPQSPAPPILAAVDGSPASEAVVETAVRLGGDLSVPLLFVYVRRGPAGFLGEPVYQRRLTRKMEKARKTLAHALRAAESAGVEAEGTVLEGTPGRRIVEFARERGAHMVVVGRRRRRLGRSVSRVVVRAARRPVIVAQGLTRPLVA